MNGTRLSLFAPIQAALGADPDTNSRTAFFFRNLAAGAACGAAGAVVGSPLFLIKARLQSQSTAHSLRTPGAGEFRCAGMILPVVSGVFFAWGSACTAHDVTEHRSMCRPYRGSFHVGLFVFCFVYFRLGLSA